MSESIKKKWITKTIFSFLLWHTYSLFHFYFYFRGNYAQKTTAQTGVISHLYYIIFVFLVAVIIVMTAVPDTTVFSVVATTDYYCCCCCCLFIVIIVIGSTLPKKRKIKIYRTKKSDAFISVVCTFTSLCGSGVSFFMCYIINSINFSVAFSVFQRSREIFGNNPI